VNPHPDLAQQGEAIRRGLGGFDAVPAAGLGLIEGAVRGGDQGRRIVRIVGEAVSYTHLTLPTICSV